MEFNLVVQWVCSMLPLLATASSFQMHVSERGLNLGTRDAFPSSTGPYRIEVVKPPEVIRSLDSSYRRALGTTDWGLIQNSMEMISAPSWYNLSEPICRLTPGVRSMTRKAQYEFPLHEHGIYDDLVFQNNLFFVTRNGDIVSMSVIPQHPVSPVPSLPWEDRPRAHTTLTTFSQNWLLPSVFPDLFTKLGLLIYEASIAYCRHNAILYIATNACLISVESVSGKVLEFNNKGYVKGDNIVFADIHENMLFVGFKYKGIDLYSIALNGTIEHKGTIGPEAIGVDRIEMHDFEIDVQPIQILNKEWPGFESKNTNVHSNPTADMFFDMQLSQNDRNYFIERPDPPILFLADESGIFLFEISTLNSGNSLPRSALFHKIAIPGARKVMRYHQTLYVLTTREGPSSDGYASHVHEVFLLTDNFKDFGDPSKAAATLYTVNTVFNSTGLLTNIYVDELFLYGMGPETNFAAERGIAAAFRAPSLSQHNLLADLPIFSVSKTIINGLPHLCLFTRDSVFYYETTLREARIDCNWTSDRKGEFVFQINSTTVDCPQKLMNHTANLTDVGRLLGSVCVNSKNLNMTVFPRPGLLDLHPLLHRWMPLFITLSLIVGVALILGMCYCMLRNRCINQDYEVVRKELEEFKRANRFEMSSSNLHADESRLEESGKSSGPAQRPPEPLDEEGAKGGRGEEAQEGEQVKYETEEGGEVDINDMHVK